MYAKVVNGLITFNVLVMTSLFGPPRVLAEAPPAPRSPPCRGQRRRTPKTGGDTSGSPREDS